MLLLHSSKLGQLGHFLAGDEKPDTISTFANWVKTCQTGAVSKSLILSVLLSIWVVFSRERHTQKKSSTTAEGATADNIGIISHCFAMYPVQCTGEHNQCYRQLRATVVLNTGY
jgi:hypothetical protein